MAKKKQQSTDFSSFVEEHRTAAIIAVIALSVLLLGGGAAIAFGLFTPSTVDGEPDRPRLSFFGGESDEEAPVPEEPAIIPRRLDGILVAREDANYVPACVMIENAAFGGVRPQSGLSKSLVTYEVIVEGGITRYMAVFAGESAGTIGPVRSARDTYLEFASEMNCAYAHAGGSFTALQALRNFALRDIDGLREPGYFWRDGGKFAPHNLFTSWELLHQGIVDHNWENEEPPSFESWRFEDRGEATGETGPAQSITIRYGGAYDSEFRYNSETALYERYNGGVLQIDAATGDTLTVNNLVVQYTEDGTPIQGKGRINWPVTGEGIVDIFHEGKRWTGRWKKPSRLERTQFYAEDGSLLPFTRGNSWVSIVPPHIETTIE